MSIYTFLNICYRNYVAKLQVILQRRTSMKRINAIYARQSVDRADSISIESQIEFCKYELKGDVFR